MRTCAASVVNPEEGSSRYESLLGACRFGEGAKHQGAATEASKRVYQKACAKGLEWIHSGHILCMIPTVVMEEEVLLKGFDIIDKAIGETEKELGC
jgi:adenosylmethionine-8-amino-7-oxononanoate aminotransferase